MIEQTFAVALAAVAGFAALAHGAHDLWAATVVHLAAVFLAAAWVARGALVREASVSTRFAPPVLLIVGAFWLSWRGSVNPGESLLALKDWGAALLLLLLAAEVLRKDENADMFLKASAPVLWLELGVILWQRDDRVYEALPRLTSASRWFWFNLSEQVPGTILNANATAAFLLAWVGVLAGRLNEDRTRGLRLSPVLLSSLAAATLGLLLLNCLWAFACLLAGLAVLTRSRRAGWGAAGIILALAAWKFGHRLDWTGAVEPQREALRRLDWWRAGLRMWTEHPWFGIGLGNFPSAYPAFAGEGPAGVVRHTRFAHGALATLAAETGAAGLAALGAVGAWLARSSRGKTRRAPYTAGLAMLALCLSIEIGVEFPGILVTAAIFAGAALAPAAGERFRPRGSIALVAGAAALALTPWLASPFFAGRLTVEGEWFLSQGALSEAIGKFSTAAGLDPLAFEPERGLARAYASRFKRERRPEDWESARNAQRRALALNRLDLRLRRELLEYEALGPLPPRGARPSSPRRSRPPK